MKSLRRLIAACAALCMLSAVFAADPSGTWTWTQQGRGGGGGGTPREVTLKLAQKDGKLTGQMSMPGRDGATNTVDITNGKVEGDNVSFTIEREFNGNKFVMNYSGKISGDTITGKSEGPGRDGEKMTRDWTAKRAK